MTLPGGKLILTRLSRCDRLRVFTPVKDLDRKGMRCIRENNQNPNQSSGRFFLWNSSNVDSVTRWSSNWQQHEPRPYRKDCDIVMAEVY